MKVIRFRRLSTQPETRQQTVRVGTPHGYFTYTRPIEIRKWEIAFSEEHLWAKLDGEMAEIVMPAKHWIVRLWRRFFPLEMIVMEMDDAES
jgi:hypothetical protein